MATTSNGRPSTSTFVWLETLEKEFDKAFVDLDLLLGEVDSDQADITYEGRQKMTALSSAFAQLVHKAQTVFQNNAKYEVGNVSAGGMLADCVRQYAHICVYVWRRREMRRGGPPRARMVRWRRWLVGFG